MARERPSKPRKVIITVSSIAEAIDAPPLTTDKFRYRAVE